jgi:hypothetical protein
MYGFAISFMESFVIIQCFIIHYLDFMLVIYTLVLTICAINYSISINGCYVHIFDLELI